MIIELAAILHDIADTKFHKGSEEDGGNMAFDFLLSGGLDTERANHVRNIINGISFKRSFEENSIDSIEFKIVQDADRLDALGAIGIARAFNFGGFKNRPLYDPDIEPIMHTSSYSYKKSTAPTLNHFYEKLFLLKDLMNTESGKAMARARHDYMQEFADRFISEWNGDL